MKNIEFKLTEQGRGAFVIEDKEEKLAEMAVAVSDGNLIVYHTEVSDKLKGQGVGLKLIGQMIEYARKEDLKVVPLCSFVHAQFERREDEYADIWNKNWKV